MRSIGCSCADDLSGRLWNAERAAKGDARAAAHLRGWRYADQRNQRRLDTSLEPNALPLSPATPDEKKTDRSEFIEQWLAAQRRAENFSVKIATARIWTINRTTGDVSYTLNGNRPSPEMSCLSNTCSPRHSVEPENALRSYLICTQNGLFLCLEYKSRYFHSIKRDALSTVARLEDALFRRVLLHNSLILLLLNGNTTV